MFKKQLVIMGFATPFLFLVVMGLMAVGNPETVDQSQPVPVRAPAPIRAAAYAAPAQRSEISQLDSQPAPQPRPVPVPPSGAARTSGAPGQDASSSGLSLLFLACTVVLVMGFSVFLGHLPGRQGRISRHALAEGAGL